MPKNVEEKLARVIKGQCTYTSKNLGFNLLVSRLCQKYKASPSDGVLKECLAELKAFVEKYIKVMQPEFDSILKA